ncbi:MAG: hypothetical protein HYX97_05595 [Chloroflexi bacterium]|nr:hypothetical protein [Chloroflexota bacterium]
MGKKQRQTSLRGRNARDGRFIKVKIAQKRKATAVVERVPLPGFGRK